MTSTRAWRNWSRRGYWRRYWVIRGVVLLSLLLVPLACGERDRGAGGQQEEGNQREVQLQVVEGPGGSTLALVPIFIQDQGPFGFALDTGASQSVVDQELVNQLQLQVVGPAREVTGISGTTQAKRINVSNWRIGENVELPAVEITALDMPEPNRKHGLRGLLGSDMLSRFQLVTIDYQNEVLLLKPPQ